MWRHLLKVLKILLLAYIAWGGWNWYSDRPFHQPDGVLAADDPQQTNLPTGDKVQVGRWTLTVRADYRITARILSREGYHFDALADLIPEDLALGWGPMSDNRILRAIDISQSNRFYYWRAQQSSPLPRDSIITHSANTHVIPRNSDDCAHNWRGCGRDRSSPCPASWWTVCATTAGGSRHRWYATTPEPARAKYYW